MIAKLVWIEAITQRPAIRCRTSRSASCRDSAVNRSARSSPRPIVWPSRMPETDRDSCTMLDMSASDSCVDLAMRLRSFPTRRVRNANSGIKANANSASCQLSSSMPTIVATTVVTLDAIDVAVFVTTFCTPPMSFEMRDCTSPVRVLVKKASDSRCRCRKTAARRSCMTRWPTWFERSVCTTPSAPVTTAMTIIPPALNDSALTSLLPIASSARFSRNAGMTPRAAVSTISTSTPVSRSLYGTNSRAMRRRFERRCAGSAGRSGALSAEWKNMPIVCQGTPRVVAGVIFDLDGVLVDSEHLWDDARRQLVRERGGTWRVEATRAMMGMSSTEWSRYMHDELHVDLAPDEISVTVVERLERAYRERLPPLAGAAAHRGGRGDGHGRGRAPPARPRIVGQPACDRRRARARRPRPALRGDRLVRGGAARQAGTRRLPRGGAAARRGARAVRRRRGLGQRDPLGGSRRHYGRRDPEPRLPARCRGTRAGGGGAPLAVRPP